LMWFVIERRAVGNMELGDGIEFDGG
jgi:hypothetical protein